MEWYLKRYGIPDPPMMWTILSVFFYPTTFFFFPFKICKVDFALSFSPPLLDLLIRTVSLSPTYPSDRVARLSDKIPNDMRTLRRFSDVNISSILSLSVRIGFPRDFFARSVESDVTQTRTNTAPSQIRLCRGVCSFFDHHIHRDWCPVFIVTQYGLDQSTLLLSADRWKEKGSEIPSFFQSTRTC